MKTSATAALLLASLFAVPALALAKLPPPSPEAKAKADEAKAKTAWTDKVSAYQLCKAQDRVAARYLSASNPPAKPAASSCADPGPFVYDPNAAAAPAPAAPQAAVAPAAK